jgi:hypothetical protein
MKADLRIVGISLGVSAFVAAAQPASADVVYWTDWTSATVGSPTGGSATGTITLPGGTTITVTYSGEVTSETEVNGTATSGYPSWLPASTYADGTVVQDAPTYRDIIAQNGGASTGVNTITFSQPIAGPVMAIGALATATTTPTILSRARNRSLSSLAAHPTNTADHRSYPTVVLIRSLERKATARCNLSVRTARSPSPTQTTRIGMASPSASMASRRRRFRSLPLG